MLLMSGGKKCWPTSRVRTFSWMRPVRWLSASLVLSRLGLWQRMFVHLQGDGLGDSLWRTALQSASPLRDEQRLSWSDFGMVWPPRLVAPTCYTPVEL